MACPKKWKYCIDVGNYGDPLHKIFNGMSASFKKMSGKNHSL